MINGIIFCRITQVCFDQRINITAWLHRVPRTIEYQMGFIIIWSRRGIPETRMFKGNLRTTTSDIKSMQRFLISNMRGP